MEADCKPWLVALEELVAACEVAFVPEDVSAGVVFAFDDDEDVSVPPSGITFGMIRAARAALAELAASA